MFEEIWEQTYSFFNGNPSKLVLWDFTDGTAKSVSSESLDQIVKRCEDIQNRIESGKGAIVAPKDIGFGLSRMFQAFSEYGNFPFQVGVFRDIETAKEWLISDK